MTSPAIKRSGGYRGGFAEPDEFLFEVQFTPFFRLGQDGFVRLPD